MSVMAVIMSAAMPVWSTAAKRMKEDELVFRGEQYAHAIALYQRKYANALPPSIDVLVNERFLRKKYLDPITGQEFQVLTGAVGQARREWALAAAARPHRAGRGGPAPAGGFGSGRPRRGLRDDGLQGSGRLERNRHGRRPTPAAHDGIGGTRVSARVAAGPGFALGGVERRRRRHRRVSPARARKSRFAVYNGRDVYNEWTSCRCSAVQRAAGEAAPGCPASGRRHPDSKTGVRAARSPSAATPIPSGPRFPGQDPAVKALRPLESSNTAS
jgi:type II secretory pathway pseudopilin PulG